MKRLFRTFLCWVGAHDADDYELVCDGMGEWLYRCKWCGREEEGE